MKDYLKIIPSLHKDGHFITQKNPELINFNDFTSRHEEYGSSPQELLKENFNSDEITEIANNIRFYGLDPSYKKKLGFGDTRKLIDVLNSEDKQKEEVKVKNVVNQNDYNYDVINTHCLTDPSSSVNRSKIIGRKSFARNLEKEKIVNLKDQVIANKFFNKIKNDYNYNKVNIHYII